MRIALDAMGGDHSPQVEVAGAVTACRDLGITVVLVGDEEALARELARHDTRGLSLEVVHASQRVRMEESPSTVLRRKRDASIMVATRLVREGRADALVSAGHTGATMAAALFVLSPLPGVERPAIATVLPTVRGRAVMLDVGANVDCKPRHLFQFAQMGAVYARYILHVDHPRVGLLSIGEEDTKGNVVTREAFRLLRASDLNFIGNVEGRDVYRGEADVVVCDGFIGNVALKISEGAAEAIGALLRQEIQASWRGRLGYLLMRPVFEAFRRKVDYAEYGGAPLLGVNGVCLICHGRSSPRAIRNALALAAEFVREAMIQHLREAIAHSLDALSPSPERATSSPREAGA